MYRDSEKMLKGRIAETLMEELLKISGNVVYRFGYESIIQNLAQIDHHLDRKTEDGQRIQSLPDYVVIDKDGKPTFVEVKFRWNAQLYDFGKERELIDRIERFWKSKILFVNCVRRPYFQVCEHPYLDAKGELRLKPLMDEFAWKIEPTAYGEFEDLVEKYLSPAKSPALSELRIPIRTEQRPV